MMLKLRPIHALVVLAVLTIGVIFGATSWLLWDMRSRELMHARLETEGLVQMFQEQTDQNFEAIDLVLRAVQERLTTGLGKQLALNSLPVHYMLKTRISGMKQIHSLLLVEPTGLIINSSNGVPEKPVSVSDRQYFLAFADGKDPGLFIDRPVPNKANGQWTLHVARRFEYPSGQLRGVLVASVNIARFEQLYASMRFDFERPMSILMADGSLLAGVPHREGLYGDKLPELGGRNLGTLSDGKPSNFALSSASSQQTLSLMKLKRFPLIVGVVNDQALALQSWRESALPIAAGAGLICLFVSMVAWLLARDLALQENLSRALSEANRLYHQTVDSVLDAIIAVDENEKIILFNPAAESMFGRKSADIVGKALRELIPRPFHAVHQSHVRAFGSTELDRKHFQPHFDVVGIRADGSEFPAQSTVSKIMVDGKVQFTAVLRDVTQLRRAEFDLREMNQQLRKLSAALEGVREEERTRLSRELHDDLGQQMTGLKLELSWLVARLKDGKTATPEHLDSMRHLLDGAITSVRRISSELRPAILDESGFAEAVSWLTRELSRRSGLVIELSMPAEDLVSDGALATALYRIVQESLTNVVRHADASRVWINLEASQSELMLMIRDDGNGFDASGKFAGIGLVSMRERVNFLHGRFVIHSKVGEGTIVEVCLPLDLPVFSGVET